MAVVAFEHQRQAIGASLHRATGSDGFLGVKKIRVGGPLADGQMWDELLEPACVGRAFGEGGPQ